MRACGIEMRQSASRMMTTPGVRNGFGAQGAFVPLLELPDQRGGRLDRQFVNALARGLEVLRAFEPQDGPLGNQEIAERTGLPKSSVSRLTHTLTALGYLEHIPRLSKYRIGVGVLALGHACIGAAALLEVARSPMESLANYADVAVALGGRDRLSMVYLDVQRGRQTSAFTLDVGARVPIHQTALGMAYLWAIPPKERAILLRGIRRHAGAQWRTIRKRLDAASEELARSGFCIAAGTFERGMNGVGTAIILQGGAEIRALSASAPAFQHSVESLRTEIGPRLLALASSVQTELARRGARY
jgi:DNA-binding IclR family transcriptional regulator